MPELPVSVRLALWVTHAHQEGSDVGAAVRTACAEIDLADSPQDRLTLWAQLGERVMVAALPRPGDLTLLPRGSRDFVAAAVEAGECAVLPTLGGALVPRLEHYGNRWEPGVTVGWDWFDCEPLPRHVLDALSLRDTDAELRGTVLECAQRLSELDLPGWAGAGPRSGHQERDAMARWGLPPSVPGRAFATLQTAARLAETAAAGLAVTSSAPASAQDARDAVLRRLSSAADRALAQATCVAAMSMAGLRPDRTD